MGGRPRISSIVRVMLTWARLSVTLGHDRQLGDVSGTLTGYAYETVPNKPIIAGQTTGPDMITVQPETLGGLARGGK